MHDLYLFGAGFILASRSWDVVFTRMDLRWNRERADMRKTIDSQAAVLSGRARSFPTDPAAVRALVDDLTGTATAWEDDAPESYGV